MNDLSIRIDTGIKKIAIKNSNDEIIGSIEFNPTDVLFAQKYYQLVRAFKEKEGEYKAKAIALEKYDALDENGVPVNAEERINHLKDLCDFTRKQIDELFGVGTSQAIFGNSYNIDAFMQFFEGMKEIIEETRENKVGKYINTRKKPRRPRNTKN